MSLSLCEGTETATAGVMITADGQLLFTPQPDPATSSDTPDGTSVQTITLPDGSTAYLQQNTKGQDIKLPELVAEWTGQSQNKVYGVIRLASYVYICLANLFTCCHCLQARILCMMLGA